MRCRYVPIALVLSFFVGTHVAAQESIDGRWEGAILVLGTELGFSVEFTTAETLTATMDIPAQNAFNLPLQEVSFTASRVHFELMGGPGLAVFDGALEGDSIGGPFEQAGVTGTFWLQRHREAAESEQLEPAPYHAEEVQFTNGEVTLAGTLTLPPVPGRHPAVVLISGSGPQNRDEEIFGFDPFRRIADYLTRRGIAVLRYDDRGVGGSTGSVYTATAEDFADDVLAAVDLLRARAEIDPKAIGLIGHSEGGIVAPIAAVKSSNIAFIVLMASTAVTGQEILLAQAERILKAGGASDEQLREQRDIQLAIFDAVRTGEGWHGVRSLMDAQIRSSLERLPPARRAAIKDPDAFVTNQINQQLALVETPWFRFFLDYDPVTDLRHVRVPVLALFGETDLQVPADLNRPPMEQALQVAGNTDVTVEVLPSTNHLFLYSETGLPAEYASLEKEFVPGFLDKITQWITTRAGRGEP